MNKIQNITAVDHEAAQGKEMELLDGVKEKLGFVPNMMATMTASPAVLEANLNMSGTLGKSLNSKMNERIALTVAEINACGYCALAHSAIGKIVGLDDKAIASARRASSGDAKSDAGLKFARPSSSAAARFRQPRSKRSRQRVTRRRRSPRSWQTSC